MGNDDRKAVGGSAAANRRKGAAQAQQQQQQQEQQQSSTGEGVVDHAASTSMSSSSSSSPRPRHAARPSLSTTLETELVDGGDDNGNGNGNGNSEEFTNRQLVAVMEECRETLAARLESFKEQAHEEIDAHVQQLREELARTLLTSTRSVLSVKKASTQKSGLRRKIHVAKESVITKMMREDSYQTIFNIALAALIAISLNLILADFMATGSLIDFSLLSWGCEGFPLFVVRWIAMLCGTFLVVPLAHMATIHTGFGRGLFLVLYAALQCAAFALSAYWSVDFHPPLRAALMAEQARLSMKMHAYLREKMLWKRFGNAYEPVSPVTSSYVNDEFSAFFYFLWAPTLVYRVKYPRTSQIRWSAVALRLLEAIGSIYYTYLVFRWVLPNFQRAGSIDSTSSFFLAWISAMGPGMALMFLAHYLVLHNVQNMFAELTRFADRGFYEDWWNARTWEVFYRKWNGVVHEFIKEYVYLDFYELARFSRVGAMTMAFLISAIIHEYIISFIFGFFFPILLLLFGGPGMLFIVLTRRSQHRVWNVFLWLMLAAGNGLMMVLYCAEWYARPQVPPPTTFVEYVTPALWRASTVGKA